MVDVPRVRVGLEIHQRLATHKLFCNCPSELREDEPDYWARRRLRVSYSELGSIDPAARFESLRNRTFTYGAYSDATCEVELDESPPLPMNLEALEIALEVSLMLGMDPVDEVHTMRKIVIDGSNTTGFQRTALVAMGGEVKTSSGTVRLKTLCLEEESAYIISTAPEGATYRLDRLGIPLIELATEADITSPSQARETALTLGRVLRATGKVQRGIGTIRQDLNVSIEGGARQEIKGVQELALIPKIVEREAVRQATLLELRDRIRETVGEVRVSEPRDVTSALLGSKSRLIRRALSNGERIFGVRVDGLAGFLGVEIQPGRRFGTELSGYAKVFGGVGGIIHSDELPGYGISEDEVRALREALGADRSDAFILVLAEEAAASTALEAVSERLIQAGLGVPEETRRALPDGNTEFMRPLPGPARMYPETDVFPVKTGPLIERILRKGLPEMPDATIDRLQREYGLTREHAEMLLDEGRVGLFERVAAASGNLSPRYVAAILTSEMRALKREGVDVEGIGEESLSEIVSLVDSGILPKEGVRDALTEVAERGPAALEDLRRRKPPSESEIRDIVRKLIRDNAELVSRRGERAFSPLMGEAMRILRGRAPGSLVSGILKEELRRALRGTPRG